MNGDPLDALDKRVEAGILGVDARLEEGQPLLVLQRKPIGQGVVARQIEVDDAIGSFTWLVAGRRRGLQQTAGEVARLGEQEQADLFDMRASRDVNQVVFAVRTEGVVPRELMERRIDLFKVPRVMKRDLVKLNLGLR